MNSFRIPFGFGAAGAGVSNFMIWSSLSSALSLLNDPSVILVVRRSTGMVLVKTLRLA